MECLACGTLHVWEKWDTPIRVYAEVFKARKLVDTSRHMGGIIKMTFTQNVTIWSGLIWLMVEINSFFVTVLRNLICL
jgi:hypothetical protein